MNTAVPAYDAVVLAGGRGSRLGGVDKPALRLRGRSLLERAVDAVPGARHIAVVAHSTVAVDDPRVMPVAEEPRWAGPVAALETGLRALETDAAPLTVVLAADLVAPASGVAELLARARVVVARQASPDGVIGVDPGGHRQPLLAVYRTRSLRAVLATCEPSRGASAAPGTSAAPGGRAARGASLRSILARLELDELHLPSTVCADIDTPADAARHGVELHGSEASHERVA